MRLSILPFTVSAAARTACSSTFTASHVIPLPTGVSPPNPSGFFKPITHGSQGGLASCVSGVVVVSAGTTENLDFDFSVPVDEIGTIQAVLDFITGSASFVKQITKGTQTANGTFDLGATFCVPANNPNPKSVQLLTHGIGFSREYWDFAPNYSYVDAAAEAGYATFAYDRLGVGESSKPDGLAVVQAPLEVAIADVLAVELRKGALGKIAFDTVIGVGHSYGSIITQAITAAAPSTFDAAILTGFSVNATALPTFLAGLNLDIASRNNPRRFLRNHNSYLVWSTIISNQIGFFHAPTFSRGILAAAEASKQTVTYGELFSQGVVTSPATNFTGPVAVVNGANDLPFCFGNCTYPVNLAAEVKLGLYSTLPADKFGAYFAPETGHGLNLHYTAGKAFAYIQGFLKEQGL